MLFPFLLLLALSAQWATNATGRTGETLMELLSKVVTKLDQSYPLSEEFRKHDDEFKAYKESDNTRVNALLVQLISHSTEIQELTKHRESTAARITEMNDTLETILSQQEKQEEANTVTHEELSEAKTEMNDTLQTILIEQKQQEEAITITHEELSDAKRSLQTKYTELEQTMYRLQQKVSDMEVESKKALELETTTVETPATTPSPLCKSGFTTIDDGGSNCYFFSNDTVNYSGATQKCVVLGSSLLVLESRHENEAIKKHLKSIDSSNYYFMSLKQSSSVWRWPDGSRAVFTDWCTDSNIDTRCDEPDGGDCIDYHPDFERQWDSTICTNPKRYICKQN